MAFAIDLCRDSDVRTGLPHGFVAQPPERCLSSCAAHIAR